MTERIPNSIKRSRRLNAITDSLEFFVRAGINGDALFESIEREQKATGRI